MNKKIWTIILGGLIILGFFLPYLQFGGILAVSGFDLVFNSSRTLGSDSISKLELYFWLIIPLAGLLLLLGALNNEKYILSRGFLKWLPLLGLLFIFARFTFAADGNVNRTDGDMYSTIIKLLGSGYWISLVAAILLVAYTPRQRA